MTIVHYTDFGIRTRTGAYWMLTIMAISAVNMVSANYVGTHDLRRLVLSLVWALAIAIGTIRSLRRLGELEKTHAEPTAAMKLAFEATVVLPIAGMVPLIVL